MTAPSRRLPRSVLWALGLFAGTTAAVILSASSASATPDPTEEHLLPATLGAVTDTVTPIREQVLRPVVKDVVLKPVNRKILKPVTQQVLKPVTQQVLKPTTEQVVKPVLTTLVSKKKTTATAPAAKAATIVQPARAVVSKPISAGDKSKTKPKAIKQKHHQSAPAKPARTASPALAPIVQSAGAPAFAPAPLTVVVPQPADHSSAPHWPSPAAPSAPTQVLSGGSTSAIAKKFAVLGGIAPQQFAVTATVTADDDLIGPAPGDRPGTTPD